MDATASSTPRVSIERVETTRGTLKVPVAALIRNYAAIFTKYSVPIDAVIEVEIPGGGDWSGERINANELDAVVTWEVERDVG